MPGPNESSDASGNDVNSKLDLLIGKIDAIDTKLTNQITAIDFKITDLTAKFVNIERDVQSSKEDIKAVKTKQIAHGNCINDIQTNLTEHKTLLDGHTDSCRFLSEEFEKMKVIPSEITQLKKENVLLKAKLDNLNNEFNQETILRNKEQQYHRTSLNVKLCGVPAQLGEDDSKSVSNVSTLEVIKRVCVAAKIEYTPDTIDVCHRMGPSDEQHSSPIIIRFKTKCARWNFFAQKKKLIGFTHQYVDLTGFEDSQHTPRKHNGTPNGATGGFEGGFGNPIYMQEHLTKRNKDLLKEARSALKENFDFPGYVMNGEVRARRVEKEKYYVIDCQADIDKLRPRKPPPTPRR